MYSQSCTSRARKRDVVCQPASVGVHDSAMPSLWTGLLVKAQCGSSTMLLAVGVVSIGNLDLRPKSRSRMEACRRRDTRSVGSKKKSSSRIILQDQCKEKTARDVDGFR